MKSPATTQLCEVSVTVIMSNFSTYKNLKVGLYTRYAWLILVLSKFSHTLWDIIVVSLPYWTLLDYSDNDDL